MGANKPPLSPIPMRVYLSLQSPTCLNDKQVIYGVEVSLADSDGDAGEGLQVAQRGFPANWRSNIRL
jgi:hypothetical protein